MPVPSSAEVPKKQPRWDESHRRILKFASRLFRERGTTQVSVDEVMSAAGLTRGGFYAHFASKTQLVVEAMGHAFREAHLRLFEQVEAGPDWLQRAAKKYLAREHLEHPGPGCVIPSLASEVARSSPEIRESFSEGFEGVIAEFQRRLGDESAEGRQRAIAQLSLWTGAMLIARAVPDEKLADELLRVAGETDVSVPRRP